MINNPREASRSRGSELRCAKTTDRHTIYNERQLEFAETAHLGEDASLLDAPFLRVSKVLLSSPPVDIIRRSAFLLLLLKRLECHWWQRQRRSDDMGLDSSAFRVVAWEHERLVAPSSLDVVCNHEPWI